LVMSLYVPFFANLIGTVPLGVNLWALILLITFFEIAVFEISKRILFFNRKVVSE